MQLKLDWKQLYLVVLAALALVPTAAVGGSGSHNDGGVDVAAAPRHDALLQQWLVQRGGKARVAVCHDAATGVRGLCSSADARAGDWLVELPAAGLLTCTSVQECARVMLAEVRRNNASTGSPLQPWLDSLPAPSALLSKCNLPERMIPLLRSQILQGEVQRVQDQLRDLLASLTPPSPQLEAATSQGAWQHLSGQGHGLEGAGGGGARDAGVATRPRASPRGHGAGGREVPPGSITLEDLRAACALASTRTLYDGSRRLNVLMPVLDLLNHRQGCPHLIEAFDSRTRKPLGAHGPGAHGRGDPGGQHVTYALVAGADVRAGEEVCISYAEEGARDDYFLLSWGFLPRHQDEGAGGPGPTLLMAADDPRTLSLHRRVRNGAPLLAPWAANNNKKAATGSNKKSTSTSSTSPRLPSHLPTSPFQGSPAQMREEVARLQDILRDLEQPLAGLPRLPGGAGRHQHQHQHQHHQRSSTGSDAAVWAGAGSGVQLGEKQQDEEEEDWRVRLLEEFQARRRLALRHEITRLQRELRGHGAASGRHHHHHHQREEEDVTMVGATLRSLAGAGLATGLGLTAAAALGLGLEALVAALARCCT